jgi:glyoxylate/hydroxypyruvate reductase A
MKDISGVRTFGLSEMDAFLSETNILVCMLPLNEDTRELINYELIRKLKEPAFFINVGRGSHVNEIDLLRAIHEEILLGACLDVVQNEPITEDNPFVKESRIIITPHVASITNQSNAARIIAENIERHKKGEKLLYQVDPHSGY